MNGQALSQELLENTGQMESLFEGDKTFILRFVRNRRNPDLTFALCYCGGMVDNALVADSVIKPLVENDITRGGDFFASIVTGALYVHNVKPAETIEDAVEAVTYGDTVVFLPGTAQAAILSTQGFPLRSIAEPDAERVLSGPKEGFCEQLITNLTFIHRRLRTNEVKMEFDTLGKRSRTKICLCYIEPIVNKEALDELKRRLETVDIDAILDANTLCELIRDNRRSPFRTADYTERPDVVAAKLLEGRIAVFLDGTPMVITLPYLFIENFQSNEDYYLGSVHASFARVLRIMGFFLTVLTPAIYIAITTYNHEILPTPLLISVTRERQSVPFPMGLEVIIMILVFDLLREAGVRMPSSIGQAMSIVGALVLGQAAVQAKIASSLVIIVVAFTGITSLLIPKMSASVIVARSGILLAALFLGFPGLLLGTAVLMAHIFSLRSFGTAQTELTGQWRPQRLKDTFFRAPIPYMTQRPPMAERNPSRMKNPSERWWK